MTDDNKKPKIEELSPEEAENKGKVERNVLRLDKHVMAMMNDLKGQIDKIGEDVLGEDFYGETKGSEDWKKLSMADRNKLRTAFAFGLLSNNVIEDFRKNPYLIAIAIGPGPLGTVLAAGLLASYTIRWDKRGKEVRGQIGEMLDQGIKLEDYSDVLRPRRYAPELLEVDDAALLKKKFAIIQDGSTRAGSEFMEKSAKLYKKFKAAAGQRISNGTHYVAKPFLETEQTDKALESMADGYEKLEELSSTSYEHTTKGLSWFGQKVGKPFLREAFESTKTAYHLLQNVAEKAQEGFTDNKKEIQDIIEKFTNGGPKPPMQNLI